MKSRCKRKQSTVAAYGQRLESRQLLAAVATDTNTLTSFDLSSDFSEIVELCVITNDAEIVDEDVQPREDGHCDVNVQGLQDPGTRDFDLTNHFSGASASEEPSEQDSTISIPTPPPKPEQAPPSPVDVPAEKVQQGIYFQDNAERLPADTDSATMQSPQKGFESRAVLASDIQTPQLLAIISPAKTLPNSLGTFSSNNGHSINKAAEVDFLSRFESAATRTAELRFSSQGFDVSSSDSTSNEAMVENDRTRGLDAAFERSARLLEQGSLSEDNENNMPPGKENDALSQQLHGNPELARETDPEDESATWTGRLVESAAILIFVRDLLGRSRKSPPARLGSKS